MVKLGLNLHKLNNYAFFCPVSRLHLTVSSPVGFANEVTPAILKALKAETVLDIDGVIDIETGTVKKAKQNTKTPEPEENNQEKDKQENKQDNPVEAEINEVEENKEEIPDTAEEPKTEEKPKKGGRKPAAKTAE